MAGKLIALALGETWLGPMLVAASAGGVCFLGFDATAEDVKRRFPEADWTSGGAMIDAIMPQVEAAIAHPQQPHDVPLDLGGTAFQRAVWDAVRAIPAGETRTYAQIATLVGHPDAARAAGGANGRNPVSVLIPCHRLVRGDGGLGGYAWGIERKLALLNREGAQGRWTAGAASVEYP